jgi:hypothetical protein
MDLYQETHQKDQINKQTNKTLLSLKEPEETTDLESNYYQKKNFDDDDELNQSVHLPKRKKIEKKQLVLDDFVENSSDEEKSYGNRDWREVESITIQSPCDSDNDRPLSSVDLLEEGIDPTDIPKEFPEKSCFNTIQNIISFFFLSIRAYIHSFTKNNKKTQ